MAAAAALRLLAEDADDLAVISAAVQDAVAKVGDIVFEAKARRLTLSFNRYRWEADRRERVRSGLQFNGVLGVQARKIRREVSQAVLSVMAVTFQPVEAPGGVVTVSFAGGGDLRVTVECVDVIMADLSPPWPTPRAPTHDL